MESVTLPAKSITSKSTSMVEPSGIVLFRTLVSSQKDLPVCPINFCQEDKQIAPMTIVERFEEVYVMSLENIDTHKSHGETFDVYLQLDV